MNAWPTLFATRSRGLARRTDPDTSHEAAERLSTRKSQCEKLLRTYANSPRPLTDEEAGSLTSLVHAWKRCSDLRGRGFITPVAKRLSAITGRMVQVCAITVDGRRELYADS